MLYLADISEFQGDVDMGAYADENPAIIIRAHNTMRVDNKWVANIVAADADPKIQWVAAYQYLTGTADPIVAARAFAAAIGPYRLDLVILDDEEGVGDQQGRQHAWLDTLTGHAEWTYSGDYFAKTHGMHPEWIAAYQQNEPTGAHRLWQCTDRRSFAGIAAPCDGSLFHGTVGDLVALTSGTPAAAPTEEEDMNAPANIFDHDGRLWTFVRGVDGTLWAKVLEPTVVNPAGLAVVAFDWFQVDAHNEITSGPAVVMTPGGRFLVTARGTGGGEFGMLIGPNPAHVPAPIGNATGWFTLGGLS